MLLALVNVNGRPKASSPKTVTVMLASRAKPQRTGKYLKLNSDFVFDHWAIARSKSQYLRELVLLRRLLRAWGHVAGPGWAGQTRHV